jgi:Prokaryotic E2 family E
MLTEEDAAFLRSTGWRFETKPDGEGVALIIYEYPLPAGYSIERSDLLLRLPRGFPDAAPDMFWFSPEVRYAGGSGPPATGERLDLEGRTWQRWSRHLATAWRPGIDNLQTYLRLIRTDLTDGVGTALAA